MKSQVLIGVLVGVVGAAALVACSSTGGGGGGTGGSTATGGGGGVGGGVGGSSSGGMPSGGSSAGGSSAGGSSAGGMPSGGSSAGGSSSGGGGSVTLPAGCANGITINCNPVTNEGCDTAGGAACDLGSDSKGTALGCFAPPNTQKLGETCSNGESGPFCQGTLHCSGETDAGGGACKKFCCSSSDCSGGTCNPIDAQLGTLGTCS